MKKDKKQTGFWAEVRELRDLIKLKVAQGFGSRSLAEAMKEQIRNGTAKTVELPSKGGKGLPAELQTLIDETPPGQQLRMSAKEYRRAMGLDPDTS